MPPGSAAYVCSGDSGGPLVDRFGTDYVAAGILSGFWDRNSPDQPPSATCAEATSFNVEWVPTDDEQIFIQSWVSVWYPHFPCKRLLRAGSSTQAYLERWGKPCKDDTVCTDKEYCSHPGSELKLCNCVGGTPASGAFVASPCACVDGVGECRGGQRAQQQMNVAASHKSPSRAKARAAAAQHRRPAKKRQERA